MRGLSEYRIRAADSISPPLASGSVSGSVSTRILLRSPSRPSARVPPGFWMLDPGICGRLGVCMRRALRRAQPPLDSGSWNLWAVGLGVRAAPGFWMLESVGGVGRCGPPGFWILDSGNWAVGGSRGVGRPDSVFCILETGLSEGGSTGVGRPDS